MRYLFLFLGLLGSQLVFAQSRHDDNWVLARGTKGIQVNFAGDSLHVDYLPQLNMRTVEANISMSDASGNLLFYSNGCFIANQVHETMDNGHGLNPGLLQSQWCMTSGSPFKQSILALPKPGDPEVYYVFHVDVATFNTQQGFDFAPLHLYYTVVNMALNNGLGKVTEKNIVLLQDTVSRGALHAVLHANGRDWWCICPEYRSNCYYTILFNPSGAQVTGKSCLGHTWDHREVTGQSLFTPNGEKFVRSSADNGLNIFDFDRCTGELSNSLHISLVPDTNMISGMAISGNSRFVYVTLLDKIYQFDLSAPDVAASKTLVATYDGNIDNGNPTDFYHAKLAPDGKIYICSYGPTAYLHTIDQPDSAGLACQVYQHYVPLPYSHFASLPNSPNFKLGAKPEPCDTISLAEESTVDLGSVVRIFPNPTDDYFYVALDSYSEGPFSIVVTDLLGRTLYSGSLRNGDSLRLSKKSIGASGGIYLIAVKSDKGYHTAGKVVIH